MSSPAIPSAWAGFDGDGDEERRSSEFSSSLTNMMNENSVVIPSAPAVLLVDDDADVTIGMTTVTENENNSSYNTTTAAAAASSHTHSQYASAQVLDLGSTSGLYHAAGRATTTYAEAVPLDPWSKTQTTSSFLNAAREGAEYHSHDDSARGNQNSRFDAQQIVVVVPESDERSDWQETEDAPRIQRQQMQRYRLLASIREDPINKKRRRRRRRRARMMVGGVTGFVFGTFVLGPLGGVAGATAGAVLARTASKIGEKRKDIRVERERGRLESEQQPQFEIPIGQGVMAIDNGDNNHEIQEAYATADTEQEEEDRGSGRRFRRGGRYRHSRSSRTR
jgi:hypothetical protein